MQATLKEGSRQKEQTDRETQVMESVVVTCRRSNNNSNTERSLETSSDNVSSPQRMTTDKCCHLTTKVPKVYSEAVAWWKGKKFKLYIRTNGSYTPDEIKTPLKIKSEPNNVGILTLKTMRDGRILIEAGSKNEIEALGKNTGKMRGRVGY